MEVCGEWSASCPGCYTPRDKAPNTHCIGGWVCPRTGLGVMEKEKIPPLPLLGIKPWSSSPCLAITLTELPQLQKIIS